MGKGIIWLASYPKSGNTWMRAFLHNYLLDPDEPCDINQLKRILIAAQRSIFDSLVGMDSNYLTAEETDALRPDFYRAYINLDSATELEGLMFLKVHDAYTFLADGRALFPADATRSIIYIVRNPLDVAISYAKFEGVSVDTMIKRMNNPHYQIAANQKRYMSQLRQRLLTWSGHVRSWAMVNNVPRLLIRYEDMLAQPANTFGAVIHFLGLPVEQDRLEKAIRFSSFKELKSQEEQKRFYEYHLRQPAMQFFNQGKAERWRECLSAEQIHKLVTHHGETMKALQY